MGCTKQREFGMKRKGRCFDGSDPNKDGDISDFSIFLIDLPGNPGVETPVGKSQSADAGRVLEQSVPEVLALGKLPTFSNRMCSLS